MYLIENTNGIIDSKVTDIWIVKDLKWLVLIIKSTFSIDNSLLLELYVIYYSDTNVYFNWKITNYKVYLILNHKSLHV